MPDISLFYSIDEIENPDSVSLEDYLDEIQNGRFLDMIAPVRKEKNSEKRKKLKKLLPGVTFSGLFASRRDSAIISHSGYICIDLDDLEEVEATKLLLSNDKFVYSCFNSTSDTGLRVLFRINGAKHRESYYGIASYLLSAYGLIPDPQSMVLSRSFYVTFDPKIYRAKNTVPIFINYVKEVEPKKKDINFTYADDDFERLLSQIQQRKIDICSGYHDWLKIGFALVDKFGEGGRAYYHTICEQSPTYNYKRNDKQYNYCMRSKNAHVATISTFFYFCKQAGLQVNSERTVKIRKSTLKGKAAGLTKAQIIENLSKNEKITDCDAIVEDIFNSADAVGEGDSLIDQVELFITTNYNLRRNDITKYIERDGVPMQQSDLNSVFISAKKIIERVDYHLMDRLLLSDYVQKYNPLIEFFKSLDDGIEHKVPDLPASIFEDAKTDLVRQFDSPLIDKLASTISNSCPAYTNYFLRKWLVGIVSAAHGTHSPLVLVLVGKKLGTGKTEWFRRLVPREIKKYYAESKLDAGKDDDILMTQKLIIMDDELGGKSKKEAIKFKELASKEIFSLREPYGRNNVDLVRLAVLCGTSNYHEILVDDNRRFILIPVDAINQELYNTIDKKELFAEMYRLYNEEFDWRVLSKVDRDFLGQHESEYQVLQLEQELIQAFYEPMEGREASYMSASEIKVEIELLTRQRCSLEKIGRELANLGFEKKTINEGVSDNGKRLTPKKWGVKKINRPITNVSTGIDYQYSHVNRENYQ